MSTKKRMIMQLWLRHMPRRAVGGCALALVLAACGTAEPVMVPSVMPAAATGAPAISVATLEPTLAPSPSVLVAPEPEVTTMPPDAITIIVTATSGPPPTPAAAPQRATDMPAKPAATVRTDLPTPGLARPKPPAAAVTPSGQWQPYQSQAYGFAASYPVGWAVAEGSTGVTFSAPNNDAQIIVSTRSFTPEPDQPAELPVNASCQTVLVGGAAATRCGDTVTLMRPPAPDGTITVVTITAANVEPTTFDGFLQQFALS